MDHAGGDMTSTRHLLFSLILSFVILFIGTAGYMIIEKWGFLDGHHYFDGRLSGSKSVRPSRTNIYHSIGCQRGWVYAVRRRGRGAVHG